MLRRGIRIKYPDMLKIKSFINYSVACPIDQGRANKVYLALLKGMNIFNRMKDIEDWLLSKEWDKKIEKKVTHIHILGNSSNMRMRKIVELDKFAASIRKNENYEVVKELNSSKVNKAISYLRWIRNKYRPNNVNYDIE
jgi:hypothetical protein